MILAIIICETDYNRNDQKEKTKNALNLLFHAGLAIIILENVNSRNNKKTDLQISQNDRTLNRLLMMVTTLKGCF